MSEREIRVGDLSSLHPEGDPVTGAPADNWPPPSAALRQGPKGIAIARAWRNMPELLPVLAGLLLVTMGLAVWLWLEQRQLAASLAALEQRARESVALLETQVASTSTTLRSADSETQKSLNLVARDIARIDANIARLSTRLDQENKARAAVDADLKATAADLRKLAQSSAQSDSQLDGRLRTLADSVDQLAARQKAQADGLARLERSGELAQLRSEVSVLGASLREMQDEHERRLKAAEQAVGSTDAFRRQVNSTIDRLNQQVAELYQRR